MLGFFSFAGIEVVPESANDFGALGEHEKGEHQHENDTSHEATNGGNRVCQNSADVVADKAARESA